MYQSFVYLEARILLPSVTEVFSVNKKTHKTTVNNDVLQQVFTFARAFGSDIPSLSPVERLTAKLPKLPDKRTLTGYSIKIAEGGSINIMFHNRAKKIFIEEIRIEEDAGRLARANGETRFDFSYAGYPSIRIHTTPSFETGEETEIFLNELRRLAQYLHIANEQAENTIRCNAFVSLSEYPDLPDYYVKLRNLNSFNFVRKAINSELTRQENMLSNGDVVKSESRLWNETKSRTEFFQQRTEIQRRF